MACFSASGNESASFLRLPFGIQIDPWPRWSRKCRRWPPDVCVGWTCCASECLKEPPFPRRCSVQHASESLYDPEPEDSRDVCCLRKGSPRRRVSAEHGQSIRLQLRAQGIVGGLHNTPAPCPRSYHRSMYVDICFRHSRLLGQPRDAAHMRKGGSPHGLGHALVQHITR